MWVRDVEDQNEHAEDWSSNLWNAESSPFVGIPVPPTSLAEPSFRLVKSPLYTYHGHVAVWSRAQCWHRHGSCGAQGAAFDLDTSSRSEIWDVGTKF